jgi:hypothetical protein
LTPSSSSSSSIPVTDLSSSSTTVPEVFINADTEEIVTGELSLAEMEALGDLVRGSSVEREKNKLNKIKTSLLESAQDDEDEEVAEARRALADIITEKLDTVAAPVETLKKDPFVDPVAEAEIGKKADDGVQKESDETEGDDEDQDEDEEKPIEAAEDMNIARMKSVVESMVERLEVDIEKTEMKLGDALQLLDLDRDGSLTVEELQETMISTLKRELQDKEAAAIVKEIDTDGDGRISVDELLAWIEKTKVSTEKENNIDEK